MHVCMDGWTCVCIMDGWMYTHAISNYIWVCVYLTVTESFAEFYIKYLTKLLGSHIIRFTYKVDTTTMYRSTIAF